MQSILSIQSYVAYGYVGNRAAVFPLQRMGFDVTAINTVQFSNHTGYGDWQGDIFSPEQLRNLVDGVRARGALPHFNALLSGYMGDAALGELIVELAQELKQLHPEFIYCCDPVIGDVGRGVFVREGIGEYFKKYAVDVADILTPNHFELNYLTDMPVDTLAQTIEACNALLARGAKTILDTSLIHEDTPTDTIQMLLHQKDGSWLVQTPRFDLDPMPNGAGDMTAALCLANTLRGLSPEVILGNTAASIYGIFKATHKANTRELQLIAAQDELVQPSTKFKVVKL